MCERQHQKRSNNHMLTGRDSFNALLMNPKYITLGFYTQYDTCILDVLWREIGILPVEPYTCVITTVPKYLKGRFQCHMRAFPPGSSRFLQRQGKVSGLKLQPIVLFGVCDI